MLGMAISLLITLPRTRRRYTTTWEGGRGGDMERWRRKLGARAFKLSLFVHKLILMFNMYLL
jgi:hypothetical protein